MEDDSDGLNEFEDLKKRFIELLFDASEKIRVVAVVDALDQLNKSNQSERLL